MRDMSASGRGARLSACAGLINQLQRCRFDSRIACLENPDTNNYFRRPMDGGGVDTKPWTVYFCKKVPTGVPYLLSGADGLSEFH